MVLAYLRRWQQLSVMLHMEREDKESVTHRQLILRVEAHAPPQ